MRPTKRGEADNGSLQTGPKPIKIIVQIKVVHTYLEAKLLQQLQLYAIAAPNRLVTA